MTLAIACTVSIADCRVGDIPVHPTDTVHTVVHAIAGDGFQQVHDLFAQGVNFHEQRLKAHEFRRKSRPQKMRVQALKLGDDRSDVDGARRHLDPGNLLRRTAERHGMDVGADAAHALDQGNIGDPFAALRQQLDPAEAESDVDADLLDRFGHAADVDLVQALRVPDDKGRQEWCTAWHLTYGFSGVGEPGYWGTKKPILEFWRAYERDEVRMADEVGGEKVVDFAFDPRRRTSQRGDRPDRIAACRGLEVDDVVSSRIVVDDCRLAIVPCQTGHGGQAATQRFHLARHGFDVEVRCRYPQPVAAFFNLRRTGNYRQSGDEVSACGVAGSLFHVSLQAV